MPVVRGHIEVRGGPVWEQDSTRRDSLGASRTFAKPRNSRAGHPFLQEVLLT